MKKKVWQFNSIKQICKHRLVYFNPSNLKSVKRFISILVLGLLLGGCASLTQQVEDLIPDDPYEGVEQNKATMASGINDDVGASLGLSDHGSDSDAIYTELIVKCEDLGTQVYLEALRKVVEEAKERLNAAEDNFYEVQQDENSTDPEIETALDEVETAREELHTSSDEYRKALSSEKCEDPAASDGSQEDMQTIGEDYSTVESEQNENDTSQSSVSPGEEEILGSGDSFYTTDSWTLAVGAGASYLDTGNITNSFRDAGNQTITEAGGSVTAATADNTNTGYYIDIGVEKPFNFSNRFTDAHIFAEFKFSENSFGSDVIGTISSNRINGQTEIDLDMYQLSFGIAFPLSFNPDLSISATAGLVHTTYNERASITTTQSDGSVVDRNSSSRRENDTNPSIEFGVRYRLTDQLSFITSAQWIRGFEANGIDADDFVSVNAGIKYNLTPLKRLPWFSNAKN